jgi:ABC-type nickel/cobalt efflux system permease component RcnA
MQVLWKAAELAGDWLPIVSIGLLLVLLSGWAAWRALGSLREPGASRPAPASGPTMPS